MKKQYILFDASPPAKEADCTTFETWNGKRNDATSSTPQPEGTVKIGDNAWLIPRDSKPLYLAKLIVAADSTPIPYAIRFLYEEGDGTDL